MNPESVKDRVGLEHKPERKPPKSERLQSFEGKGRGPGNLSRLQISRILVSLRAGGCEKQIAAREGLSEATVRWIRRIELARIERALACVRVGLAGVSEMVSEQDRSTWEDLLEREGA